MRRENLGEARDGFLTGPVALHLGLPGHPRHRNPASLNHARGNPCSCSRTSSPLPTTTASSTLANASASSPTSAPSKTLPAYESAAEYADSRPTDVRPGGQLQAVIRAGGDSRSFRNHGGPPSPSPVLRLEHLEEGLGERGPVLAGERDELAHQRRPQSAGFRVEPVWHDVARDDRHP